MLRQTLVLLALLTWLVMPLKAASAAEESHSAAPGQGAARAAERVSAAASHEGAPAAGEPGGEGEKKPSLVPNPADHDTWMHALWVLIIFAVMLIVLYPTAWKQVLAGLQRREERIRKDIADAEATRARAEATLREYGARLATAENQVREMIASASAQAEKIAAEIRAKGQAEAEEAQQRATREIDAARQQAITEIYDKAAEISTSIASKILRRNISADDQKDLVQRSLEELESSRK